MEPDYLNPRPRPRDPVRNEVEYEQLEREAGERGWLWPLVGLGALLLAGLLFFGTMAPDRPNTQVSQNAERPAPTTPNTTTTPNKTAPTPAPKQP